MKKAKKPLAGAKVEVVEDEENPGLRLSRNSFEAHFQLGEAWM